MGRAAGRSWQGVTPDIPPIQEVRAHAHTSACHACDGRFRRARLGGIGAATQQAAKDRFAQDAQGARIVSAPSTAAASTVTGTVSAKRLGVSSNATAGSVARAAVDRYAGLLGVSNAAAQLRYAQATTDGLGQRHVRFDQLAGDVPVYDGAVTVHLAAATR